MTHHKQKMDFLRGGHCRVDFGLAVTPTSH